MMFPHVLNIQPSGADGRDGGNGVDKMRLFSNGVNHYHDAIC